MKLYDNLTQNTLNSIIYKMLNYITINTPLNLHDGLNNDYINLNVDLGEGISAGDEFIINKEFIIDCSNLVFNHLDYALKLFYYDLSADIDGSKDGEVVKELIVPLTVGDNPVKFDNYPVYLQGDCELLIYKQEKGVIQNGVHLKLTADHNVAFRDDYRILTVKCTENGEPLVNKTITLYREDKEIGDIVTDENGIATLEEYRYPHHGQFEIKAIYEDYSSNILKITNLRDDRFIKITIFDWSFKTCETPFEFTKALLIDWGDGKTSEYTGGQLKHSYKTQKSYTITIYGNITELNHNFIRGNQGLRKVIIDNAVHTLHPYCIAMSTVTRIELSPRVKVMESYCFNGDDELTRIVLNWTSSDRIIQYNKDWSRWNNTNITYSIPAGTMDLYIAKKYPKDKLVERSA